jgi:hypothetical protein
LEQIDADIGGISARTMKILVRINLTDGWGKAHASTIEALIFDHGITHQCPVE